MLDQDETVTLTAADGFTSGAYVAHAEGTAKGAVVILQEIFGVTEQLQALARSFAADGYDAIVPALFDRTEPNLVVPFDEAPRGRDVALALDPDKVRMDVEAACAYVDTGKGVSLIGFCWGGGQAYRLACHLDLAGAVAYYGTALQNHIDKNPGGPKCPMLFHFGETDDHTPPEVIKAVRKAVPSTEVAIYAAGHAFANDARPAVYDEASAVHARQRTMAFLNARHGG